jgi:DNA-directed RNA polymerase specialized sigma subunit
MPDNQPSLPLSSPAVAAGSITPTAPRDASAYRVDLDETELVRRYAPIVKRLARHLQYRLPQAVQLDDLVQAGLMAVLRIVRRTDHCDIDGRIGRRAIVNAMIDEARRTSWAPTRTVRLARSAAAAMRAVRQRLGRDGNDEDIAAELAITLDQYDKMLVEVAGISLLDVDAFDDAHEPALQVAGNQEETLRLVGLPTRSLNRSRRYHPVKGWSSLSITSTS